MRLQTIPFLLIVMLSFSCSNNKNSAAETSETEDDIVPSETVVTDEELQVQEPDTLFYCLMEGEVGAGGFDLVNYHTENSAVLGKQEITAVHNGVVYRFVTEENKTEFLSKPEYYLPAYGGWCAMTLAMGRATTPVYENFLIDDNGRLHLFERTVSVNGRTLWLMDPTTNAQVAGNNYDDYREDGIIEAGE